MNGSFKLGASLLQMINETEYQSSSSIFFLGANYDIKFAYCRKDSLDDK